MKITTMSSGNRTVKVLVELEDGTTFELIERDGRLRVRSEDSSFAVLPIMGNVVEIGVV